jgi:hypothetical protein
MSLNDGLSIAFLERSILIEAESHIRQDTPILGAAHPCIRAAAADNPDGRSGVASSRPSGAIRSRGHMEGDIPETVREIVYRFVGGISAPDDAHLWNDLYLTETDRHELMNAVEIRFNLDFTSDEMHAHYTVGSLIALVETKLQEAT